MIQMYLLGLAGMHVSHLLDVLLLSRVMGHVGNRVVFELPGQLLIQIGLFEEWILAFGLWS